MSRAMGRHGTCSECAFADMEMRRLIALDEGRQRTGRHLVGTKRIAELKAAKAACATRGHHDPRSGPDSRWHREPVTSNP